MPQMNGLDAARELRKNYITTPIIALTANAMKGDDKRCIEAGCNDYLAKPIDRQKLAEKITLYFTSQKDELHSKIDSAKSQIDQIANLCCENDKDRHPENPPESSDIKNHSQKNSSC